MRLDNFRELSAWGIPNFRNRKTWKQDKGHDACCQAFINAIKNRTESPIPIKEIFEVQDWLLTQGKS